MHDVFLSLVFPRCSQGNDESASQIRSSLVFISQSWSSLFRSFSVGIFVFDDMMIHIHFLSTPLLVYLFSCRAKLVLRCTFLHILSQSCSCLDGRNFFGFGSSSLCDGAEIYSSKLEDATLSENYGLKMSLNNSWRSSTFSASSKFVIKSQPIVFLSRLM